MVESNQANLLAQSIVNLVHKETIGFHLVEKTGFKVLLV